MIVQYIGVKYVHGYTGATHATRSLLKEHSIFALQSDDATPPWPPERPGELESPNAIDSFSFPLTLHCGSYHVTSSSEYI